VIVANHMGEDVIPFLVVAGAAVPAALVPVRARLSRLRRALRRFVAFASHK
jgi:hypothetical protein